MIILGVDPGTARIGWAVINSRKLQNQDCSYGCITTNKKDSPEHRLLSIYNDICGLIRKYHPDSVSVEELFFSSNAKTAIAVGQARGVILLASASLNVPVFSYAPLTVKLTICGYGKADKIQVQKMVKQILALPSIPKPDDTADAVAIALTHAYSYKIRGATI